MYWPISDFLICDFRAGYSKQAIPLYLEGIHAILTHSPTQLRDHAGFQEMIWYVSCETTFGHGQTNLALFILVVRAL